MACPLPDLVQVGASRHPAMIYMMKKILKKQPKLLSVVILLAIMWLTAINACAATRYSDGIYTFEKAEDNTAVIVDCALTDAEITIPCDVLDYPVSGVGDYAFLNNSTVRSVTLPATVTFIGSYAFAGNAGLESVLIPPACEQIADNAFWNSTNVTILCYEGSYAQTYAQENEIAYSLLEDFIPGDADGNGRLEIIDVTLINRRLAKMEVPDPDRVILAGDFNGNHILEIIDATLIQRCLSGLDVSAALLN